MKWRHGVCTRSDVNAIPGSSRSPLVLRKRIPTYRGLFANPCAPAQSRLPCSSTIATSRSSAMRRLKLARADAFVFAEALRIVRHENLRDEVFARSLKLYGRFDFDRCVGLEWLAPQDSAAELIFGGLVDVGAQTVPRFKAERADFAPVAARRIALE